MFSLALGLYCVCMSHYTPGRETFCCINNVINYFWLLSNVLQRFWLYHHDRCHVLSQMYDVWCWNSSWWWSYEWFCLPINCHCLSAPLCHLLTVRRSGKAHENFDYTAIMHWRLCTKIHPGSEVVSTVIIFLLAAIAHSTWTAWLSCDVHELKQAVS